MKRTPSDMRMRTLKTLKRRRDYLAARIAAYRHDGDPSHDKAERNALDYAIAVIEEAHRRGILAELLRVRVER
jgi:hypothetical protein